MSKTLSFLKILLKNSFSKSSRANRSKIRTSNTFLFLIFALIVFYVYTYTNIGIDYLVNYQMERFVPAIAYIIVILYIILMSFSKTKNILFNSKDNSYVFSLPLSKNQIFIARMLNVCIINYIMAFLVFLTCCVFYAIRLKMGIEFYIMSFILTLFLPLLATAISVIIAYFIAYLVNKLKCGNTFEIVFNFVFLLALFMFVFSIKSIASNFIQNTSQIKSIIMGPGYFIKTLHMALIHNSIKDLIIFIAINIVSILIVSLVFSAGFKKIILSQNNINIKSNDKLVYNTSTKFITMLKKEFRLYTGSALYFVNTFFGVILYVIFTIYMIFTNGKAITAMLPSLFYTSEISISPLSVILLIISFIISTANTACSSISIEGNKIWILKILPQKVSQIIEAKIALNMLLVVPISCICSAIICVILNVTLLEMILLILYIVLFSLACYTNGIFTDIKNPKLDWQNEAEVVKQSKNSFIAVFIPMMFSFVVLPIIIVVSTKISFSLIMFLMCLSLLLINIALTKNLNKKCEKYFKEI